jgi:hypothetical protein
MSTRVPTSIVQALRQRLQSLDGGAQRLRAVLPFGIPAIDDRLPDGGLALGALHEVAGGGNGAIDGAAAALFAAGIAARTRGRVLWCVTRQDLFAPAIAAAGLAPDRVICVEAEDEKTVLACFEEGLREHSGVGAVIAEVARLSMTASRRLQLAAEGSGAIGIAIRRLPVFLRMRGKVRFAGAANSSPPPCGEGWEVGVGRCGTAVPYCTTPHPIPPPHWNPRIRGFRHSIERSKSATADFDWGRESRVAAANLTFVSEQGTAGAQQPPDLQDYFAQPTAAVTRWRVSALPSAPLPVAGVGRARWRLELIRCRGGEAACFDVEACDAQGRLALPSDLVHGPGQEATGRRGAAR